jgi:hypothetical protein
LTLSAPTAEQSNPPKLLDLRLVPHDLANGRVRRGCCQLHRECSRTPPPGRPILRRLSVCASACMVVSLEYLVGRAVSSSSSPLRFTSLFPGRNQRPGSASSSRCVRAASERSLRRRDSFSSLSRWRHPDWRSRHRPGRPRPFRRHSSVIATFPSPSLSSPSADSDDCSPSSRRQCRVGFTASGLLMLPAARTPRLS